MNVNNVSYEELVPICACSVAPHPCRYTTSVMDDLVVEDDGYSDDDLDALPDNAFHELQENAIRSTQQPVDNRVKLPTFKSPRTRGIASGLGRMPVGGRDGDDGQPDDSHQASSDYGDFDDEMLDGEIFDAAGQPVLDSYHERFSIGQFTGEKTQREQWRQQQYGAPLHSGYQRPQQTFPQQHRIQVVPNANSGTASSRSKSTELGEWSHSPNGLANDVPGQIPPDVDALQAQVQKVIIVCPQFSKNC